MISFLGRLHISSGAAVLFAMLFIFMMAIYKIEDSNLQKSKQVSEGVCKVVLGSNKGIAQTKARIQGSIDRYRAAGKAEEDIADVWRGASKADPKNPLAIKLIAATENLAKQDRAFADDLQKQLDAVKPLALQGC